MSLSTGDIAEIQNLAGRYCHLMDAGDGENCAALFAPDAVFEIVDLMTSEGREAIAGAVQMFPQVLPGVRHLVTTMAIDGDGDSATMQAYLLNLNVGDEPSLKQTGTYADELVKIDGHWHFARRTLTMDGPLM